MVCAYKTTSGIGNCCYFVYSSILIRYTYFIFNNFNHNISLLDVKPGLEPQSKRQNKIQK